MFVQEHREAHDLEILQRGSDYTEAPQPRDVFNQSDATPRRPCVWLSALLSPLLKPLLVCLLSHSSRVHLVVTLLTVAHHALLSMRFSRQDYSSQFSCPPPGDLLNPRIEPMSLRSPALAGRVFLVFFSFSFLPLAPPGKPSEIHNTF